MLKSVTSNGDASVILLGEGIKRLKNYWRTKKRIKHQSQRRRRGHKYGVSVQKRKLIVEITGQ